MKKLIPGTAYSYTDINGFDAYKQMIEIGNGLSLNQVCNITTLQPHMIQNWVKRGYIPHPINKKYYTKHLARILLINSLKECMYIEDIGSLMVYINGDVDDETDDKITDEDLYKLFSSIIYELNDLNKVDELINKKVKDKTLNNCMKVMVNAYVGSLFSKKSDDYLQTLK